MAKSIEQIVTELADREAIRELPVKYCDCVWRNDMAGLVNLFAKDGEFITKGRMNEHRASGRDSLMKLYNGLTAGELTPRPYIHNHVLELKGDGRASGRCYVEIRDAQHNFDWAGSGFYDDDYVKEDGGWKFKSRTFQAAHMARMPGKRP
ncbi:MAG TPA: nuclear transport factor 2 family protein [Candidatus Binataceae bacterium]|nr:nuclear transport factor 2 family protein [Candidatus Binataceae bacterium]